MSKKAASYVRSSKDRAEVSLDAQREELQSLALKHDLEIVAEYEDAVYSGSHDERPGFIALRDGLKAKAFSTLLVYDTSRIARNRLIAQVFKRECERFGVRILYATMPSDLDPVTSVLLDSVYEAVDQMHSMTSRKKGLAGMRQNIARGWRAGGRAPLGYVLKHEPTGGKRDGRPVMKSKLELAPEAHMVRSYLEARARAEPRAAVLKRLCATWPTTTLVAVEWNALVYAGHTVWNRHREKKLRGSGQSKRRPRSEWFIQRDTHPALITELEAEAILTRLETSVVGEMVRNARAHSSTYLLSGLLVTSDGRPWVGAGKRYRLKPMDSLPGKYVDRVELEQSVLERVRGDLCNDSFVNRLAAVTREWYPPQDPGQELEKEALRIDREADKAAKLALQTEEPGAFIALMEGKRRQAEAVRRQAEAARRDNAVLTATQAIGPETVRQVVTNLENNEFAIRNLVARVRLEPDLTCTVDYLPALDRSLSVASPRRAASWAISRRVA